MHNSEILYYAVEYPPNTWNVIFHFSELLPEVRTFRLSGDTPNKKQEAFRIAIEGIQGVQNVHTNRHLLTIGRSRALPDSHYELNVPIVVASELGIPRVERVEVK